MSYNGEGVPVDVRRSWERSEWREQKPVQLMGKWSRSGEVASDRVIKCKQNRS